MKSSVDSENWIYEEIKRLEQRTTKEGLIAVNRLRRQFKKDPNVVLKYLALVTYNSYNRPEYPYKPLPTESGIVSL